MSKTRTTLWVRSAKKGDDTIRFSDITPPHLCACHKKNLKMAKGY